MTYQYANGAYEYLQVELANSGVETFVKEDIISPLNPASPVLTDPSTQASLSDDGYFDGNLNHNPPQLPTDLIVPLRVWERQTGSNSNFLPMEQANDGLPSITPTYRFQIYEWRENDGIYFPAAIQANDLRLRYIAMLPMLVVDTDPVQIRSSINAMAWLTAWQYALTSGDSMIADTCFQGATRFIEQMLVRSARRNQRGSHRRRGYSARFSGWGYRT